MPVYTSPPTMAKYLAFFSASFLASGSPPSWPAGGAPPSPPSCRAEGQRRLAREALADETSDVRQPVAVALEGVGARRERDPGAGAHQLGRDVALAQAVRLQRDLGFGHDQELLLADLRRDLVQVTVVG